MHYLFWIFIFLFTFDFHFWEGNWSEALLGSTAELGMAMGIFYGHYSFSLPKWWRAKQWWQFGVFTLVFYAIFYAILHFSTIEYYIYEGSDLRNFMSISLNYILFTLLAILYWNSQQTQRERERQLQLKSEKLATEMQFLKTQISPHFIFNSLNNIYSLVQQQHVNAAPMLAKLSKILRYILYDNHEDKVLITKELAVIKDYIALQQMRKLASDNIDFYQEGAAGNLHIAPMILLHFVENCFKHSGVETDKQAWIKMECSIANDKLYFSTENSRRVQVKSEVGGIGNSNICRQLELYYPELHDLKITNSKESYRVDLLINLI
ncbi:MAG: sensor histidine kinase [Saprospiraceae bacterium]